MENTPRFEEPTSPQEKLSFEPHTVAYRATAGEIAQTRNLDEVRRANELQNREVFETDDGLGAIMEVGQDGKPTVKTYWDEQGRVCKTEFIGDRGAIGTDGITNIYEYDDKGRLQKDYQLIHPKDEEAKMFRGSEYEYLPSRPDQQYTEHVTKIDGSKETLTYEDRQKKKK
jgi:hypothetical protein